MKRILVIGGRVAPSPSANSVCVNNILQELSIIGYDCHFLGLGEKCENYEENGVKYHVISIAKKKKRCFSRAINVLHLASLPETEPDVTEKKYLAAIQVHNQYNFDVIIGVCSSYSNVYSAIKMKEAYPKVQVGGYYLDTLESLSQMKGITRKLRDYYSYKGELKAFQKLDFIILPPASSKLYCTNKYNKYKEKILYADFPTYIPKKGLVNPISENKLALQAMMVGTLNNTYRNPTMLFESLLKVCNDERKLIIDVYGTTDKSFFSVFDNCEYITYHLHGKVPHSEIDKAITKTDLLINISNYGMLAVPSKIFEFFSSYKPMLTQVSDKNDSSLTYYKKYPAGHIFYAFERQEEQIISLGDFLMAIKNIKVDADEIDKLFQHNTPAYVASQIKELIERN